MSPVPRPLSELLAPIPAAEVRGDQAAVVADLGYRSDEASPASLFFCVRGATADGHDFAPDAVGRGASVVVVERWLELPDSVAQVRVPSVRAAMGPMAAAFFQRPADTLTLIGVTGTNGKTTTTYLMEGVFEKAGLTSGVIGTTGVRVAGRPRPQARTTPEAPDLHRLLIEMSERGVRGVAMEVSSHGLDQHRVGGILFDCAVFTNLSQDHLDYHGSLDAYFDAKARLFTPEMTGAAVVNRDSPHGLRLLETGVPTLTYGTEAGADIVGREIRLSTEGIQFRVDGLEIRSPLRGAFNVYNCLAALTAARQVGISDDAILRGIEAVGGVPGRMEPIDAGQPFEVLVDYAHTPDSLENVLHATRTLAGGRVIAVFGCGGDRDRAKRPRMGESATRLADLTFITSDNPRSEDPAAIISEIETGAGAGGGAYEILPDRRTAIRSAIAEARPGDVVVIAGKGHETGQEFADRTVPFDDRVVAREELSRRASSGSASREETEP
ncbi:MAG: UDP-N-acetylmuramoyl-L-alanyl-D-glutamate--2,6-diaminopimelate ligase [Actinomycetota bacterium]